MITFPKQGLAAVFLCALGSAVPAQADPLTIQSGFLFLDNRSSGSFGVDFVLYGSEFTLVGEAEYSPEFLEGFFCTTCMPVRSNAEFRLQFSPDEVIDPSSNSSCPGCGYEGDLTFVAPSVVITRDGVIVPFTVSGTLAGFTPGSSQLVFRQNLSGSGTVSVSENFVRYDFAASAAPVPEPSTMLLLGTGAVGLVARLRKRRMENQPQ